MPSLPPAIRLEFQSAGEGPLVVGLHDIGRTSADMMRALKPLLRNHRVVVPDLRGHGASPTPEGPWSVDDFSSDVARLVAAEGGDAIVVGVGLGAATAIALALGHPGLVSGLVLSGVSPRAEDPDGRDRWAKIARALRERGAEGVALSAEAMGTRPDWRGALVQVEGSAIVVAGSRDRVAPPSVQRELAAWMPGARFETLTGVGHDIVAEKPKELVQAVRRLQGVARQPVAA
ncbi:MAG: alpha/beta fold hydrolase [Actinomycetota bacterium]